MKATHLDPAGVDVGESDPFSSGAVGDPTEGGMSQSRIDSMVAQLMPGWGGSQCSVDGQLVGCGLANSLASGGAAAQCPDNFCSGFISVAGVSVYATYRAYADGYESYLPAGIDYVGDDTFIFNGVWTDDGKSEKNVLTNDPNEGLIAYFLKPKKGQGGGRHRRRRPKPSPSPVFKPVPAPPTVIPSSNPQGLPPCAQKYLSKFYDPALLNAIRYSTDGTPAWVPKHYKIFGEAGAFTMEDHIYFKDVNEFNPSDGISNREMTELGHEIEHSVQYRQNGLLTQAAKYFFDLYQGASVGYIVGRSSQLGDFAYGLNKLEIDAIGMQNKIDRDLQANGNPCK